MSQWDQLHSPSKTDFNGKSISEVGRNFLRRKVKIRPLCALPESLTGECGPPHPGAREESAEVLLSSKARPVRGDGWWRGTVMALAARSELPTHLEL
ncbi:hypothetical protein MHYP_G00348090 [Metynnis hypsauchen]